MEKRRRYAVSLLPGDDSAGRRTESVTMRTSSARFPRLKVATYTRVEERIYTSADPQQAPAIFPGGG